MLDFLKARRVDGEKFVFNFLSEPIRELEEGFVDGKEWRRGEKKVFIYKDKLITSHRIGPVDRTELVVIDY